MNLDNQGKHVIGEHLLGRSGDLKQLGGDDGAVRPRIHRSLFIAIKLASRFTR